MPQHVNMLLQVDQARLPLVVDSDKFYTQLTSESSFIDDLDCFNFRKFLQKEYSVYSNTQDVDFVFTTSQLPKNPKIENTVIEYVKKHMTEYLKDGNYNLFLSGGIDSENIANIFLECKIPFTPIIVAYGHEDKVLNDYDIQYAFNFCKEHSITPTVIDIPIIDFFNSGKAIRYAREYGCVSPQFTPILEAFNKVDGNIIYSGHQKIFTNLFYNARKKSLPLEQVVEDYTFNNTIQNDINFMEKNISFFVFDRYIKDRNDDSISDFYNCNVDMSLTSTNNMLLNTEITYENLLDYNGWKINKNIATRGMDWIDARQGDTDRNKKNRRLKKVRYDYKVAQIYSPNKLNARPRTKFTGFEGIKKFYSDKYIGKDLLLQQFDKYFRATMEKTIASERKSSDMIVNYILREN